MNGSADKWLIEQFKLRLPFEDDVAGVFCLHNAPAISQIISFNHRAISLSNNIEYLMEIFHPDFIGDVLGDSKIGDFQKDIILEGI